MNGNEAAEIVERMCREADHNPISGTDKTGICPHCRSVAYALREKHRTEIPPLSTATVYLVVDDTGLSAAVVDDEPLAIRKARPRNGVVAALPVSSDWRNAPAEES